LFKDELLKELQQERTLAELYQLFPGHSQPSIRGTVYKMLYAGQLERTDEGKYLVKGKSKTPALPKKPTRKKREAPDATPAGKPVEPEMVEPPITGAMPPSGDLNQVLAEALAKFSGSGGAREKSRRRSSTQNLPPFEKVARALEAQSYTLHEDFHIGIGKTDIAMHPSKRSAVAKWPDDELEGERYRLPDNLVENGRMARNTLVRTEDWTIHTQPLFKVLQTMGVKNTRRLREHLRFVFTDTDIGSRCFVNTPGSGLVVILVANSKDRDSTAGYELVRV